MSVQDLLARPLGRELLEAPLVASLATLEPGGSVHVVPIWYLWDGDAVLMATSSTSRKVRNLERDARATVMIHDSPGGVDVRGVSLAGRVEILRFLPERGSSWDSTASEAAVLLRESGEYADSSKVSR
jgi:PPOX class probable F420-dependent enzyme